MFEKFSRNLTFLQRNRFFSQRPKRTNVTYNEHIRVNAIDHDGCFGLQNMNPNEVSSMHIDVIMYLMEQKKLNNYTIDYVISSSNRQSIPLDCLNALYNENNLAFPVAKSLATALNAWFDPFLLADVTANKKSGFTISCVQKMASLRKLNLLKNQVPREILDELLKENHPGFTFSEDKVNIIYAQMHHFAARHPKATIHFNVNDDLHESVLNPLNKFYRTYSSLIPFNTTLKLYHFSTITESSYKNANLPTFIYEIKGSGLVDYNYYKTVQVMEEIAKNEEGDQSKYHMGNYINPENIEHYFNRSSYVF